MKMKCLRRIDAFDICKLFGLMPLKYDEALSIDYSFSWNNIVPTILTVLAMSLGVLVAIYTNLFLDTISRWQTLFDMLWLVSDILSLFAHGIMIKNQAKYISTIQSNLKNIDFVTERSKLIAFFVCQSTFQIIQLFVKYFKNQKVDQADAILEKFSGYLIEDVVHVSLCIAYWMISIETTLSLIWIVLLVDSATSRMTQLRNRLESCPRSMEMSTMSRETLNAVKEIQEQFDEFASPIILTSISNVLVVSLACITVFLEHEGYDVAIRLLVTFMSAWLMTNEGSSFRKQVSLLENSFTQAVFKMKSDFSTYNPELVFIVLSNLKTKPCLSAYDYFYLHQGVFVSVISIIATYAVVILQYV